MNLSEMLKDATQVEKLTGVKCTADSMKVVVADGMVNFSAPIEDMVYVRTKSNTVKMVYKSEAKKLADIDSGAVIMFGTEATRAKQVTFSAEVADQEFFTIRNPQKLAKLIGTYKKEFLALSLEDKLEVYDEKRTFHCGKTIVDPLFTAYKFIAVQGYEDKMSLLEWAQLTIISEKAKRDEKEKKEAAKALLNNPFSSAIVEALMKGATDKELAELRAKYDAAQKQVEAAKAAKTAKK